MTNIFLSVVAPCYNEEEGVREFVKRSQKACEAAVDDAYELVLVDDGSTDSTWDIIEELAQINNKVVAVRLMRNHGHQIAATAGLAQSRGERVLLIDADLQDPPELLPEMMREMDSQCADVVYGKRKRRTGESYFKLVTASFFYRMLASMTDVNIPLDTGDFRLMTRRVVDVLVSMPERGRFLRGMVSWIGGKQIAFVYDRDERFAGVTKYPLLKMLKFATDAFTSFSIAPLRIAVWLGLTGTAFSLTLMLYTFVQWLGSSTVVGWSSLMTAITLLASLQLLILGVIGEYVGRLYSQAQGRPLFLLDKVVSRVRDTDDAVAGINRTIKLSNPTARGREKVKLHPGD